MTQLESLKRPSRRASRATLASDARLAKRASRGDDRAFEAIFQRYHQEIYRFCLSMLGNAEDARDALQNTMVKVLRALPGEEREIRLRPWLYSVARNESIDLFRQRRESAAVDVELADPGDGPAETISSRERLRQLFSDLAALPERQRAALTMREMGGLEFEQIGEAFDTSAAVARQTVYEARLSLRDMKRGREMTCEEVMHRLSNADGRVSRRRDIQAHLRTCPDCRAFHDGIEARERDFKAIAPLPALAAAGVLHAVLGGASSASAAVAAGAAGGGGAAGATSGTAGGAAIAAGAGKAITAGLVAKSVATVAVVAAVGVTAADRSGLIHTGLPGDSGNATPAKTEKGGGGSSSSGSGSSAGGASAAGNAGHGKEAKHGKAGSKRQGGRPGAGHGATRAHRTPPSHHGHETAAAHRHSGASHGGAPSHPASHGSPPGQASTPSASGGAAGGAQPKPAAPPAAPPSQGGGGPPPTESSPELEQPSGPPGKGAETQADSGSKP